MTRDKWLEQLNNYGYAIGIDYKEAQALPLIAEYDRLTALNAQLLEACKYADAWMTEVCTPEFDVPTIEGKKAKSVVQAAIRAAEEEP